jgi:endoglucanase
VGLGAGVCRAVVTACVVALTLALTAMPASAGTANSGLPHASRHDPLKGITWGVYQGSIDDLWPAYASAHGHNKQLLGRIALKPRAVWGGSWDGNPKATAQESVADSTQGNPDLMAQVAIFRLSPWEDCSASWSAGNQASYRAWVDGYAAGLGNARVAVIVQPDMPFAICVGSSVPEQLVAYAAKVFNALPHATVYIDAGSYQWDSPSQMAEMLLHSGIWQARGFALDVTQYGSTDDEIQWGAQINDALAAAGARGRHFVVNTDENGTPYLAGQVPGGGGRSNYTPRCTHPGQQVCQRLGIPPTTDVDNPRWHLSAGDARIAAAQVDAYMWLGRPWLINAGPFSLSDALDLGANALYP